MGLLRIPTLRQCGLFQEQFDTPLLREYFPDQPILAYFEFAPPAEDEVSRVVKDAMARSARTTWNP